MLVQPAPVNRVQAVEIVRLAVSLLTSPEVLDNLGLLLALAGGQREVVERQAKLAVILRVVDEFSRDFLKDLEGLSTIDLRSFLPRAEPDAPETVERGGTLQVVGCLERKVAGEWTGKINRLPVNAFSFVVAIGLLS